MRYAVSNWIYRPEALVETFKRLNRYGYDGVELEGEPDRYQAAAVKRLCAEFDLQVLSIAGMYPLTDQGRDLSNSDQAIRQQAVDYVKRACDLAAGVGAPLVIVVPSLVGKVAPAGDHPDEETWMQAAEDEWKYAVESVSEAAQYAEKVNVLLAVEPINRYETYLVNTAEQALQFVVETDSRMVRVHLDTFHMNIEESDPSGAIRQVGDFLVNVHIADNNRQAVGRGGIDFRAIMQALYDIGYSRSLAMEPLPPVPDPYIAARLSRFSHLRDEYAQECIARLRELEEQVSQ